MEVTMTEGEIDLKKCLRIIQRRKIFIIVGTILFMVVAAIIVALVSPVYQSSSLLKIGAVYLPPKSIRSDLQLLEPPRLLAEVIDSQALLKQAWESSRGNTNVTGRMEAEIFHKGDLPLIELSNQNRAPQLAFDLLNEVVKIIIDQHSLKYESNQKALNALIANSRQNIENTEKNIAAQIQHLQEISRISNGGKKDLSEFKKDLNELSPSTISPVELLLFQSSSLNEGTFIAQLNQVQADLRMAIETNQENILTLRTAIINLENRSALSVPTEIIRPAVLPLDPISPKKKLIILIAGFMGLVFTTLYVFFREYIKD